MVLATTGPQRVKHDASEADHNVGGLERWLSVLGGSALAVYGIDRRDLGGAAVALLGAELVRRGVTGHCLLYGALGISTEGEGVMSLPHRDAPRSRSASLVARHAIKIENSVTVNRPAEELYAFWRDASNLPRFMTHLEACEVIDDMRARWRLKLPAGRSAEFVAEIINDVPNELIAWKSEEGADVANAGSVHFRAAPGGRGTEVRLVFDAEPPGGGAMPKSLAKLLGKAPDHMIREDLRRFKQLMETGDLVTSDGPHAR
jgi:uncharacterized membrane protein